MLTLMKKKKKEKKKREASRCTKHCFLFISEKLFSFFFLGLILFSCVRCVSLTKKCHQFAFSSQFAFSVKLFKSTYVRICPLARPFYPVVITSISYFIVWEKMTCRYIWDTSCLFTHPKKLDCNIIFEKRKRKRKKQQVHSSSNNKAIWKIGTPLYIETLLGSCNPILSLRGQVPALSQPLARIYPDGTISFWRVYM